MPFLFNSFWYFELNYILRRGKITKLIMWLLPPFPCCFLPPSSCMIHFVSWLQPHSLRALHKGIFCSMPPTHIDTVPLIMRMHNTCSCALLNPRRLLFTAREPTTMSLSALSWDEMLLALCASCIPSAANTCTLSFKTFSLFRTYAYMLELEINQSRR